MGRGRKEKQKAKAKRRQRSARNLRPQPAKPAVKRVDEGALKALIDRAGEQPLSAEERAELSAVVETLAFVMRELDTQNLTLRRLRSLFGLAKSEKLKAVLQNVLPAEAQPEDEVPSGEEASPDEAKPDGSQDLETSDSADAEPAQPSPPGHGRNSAGDYSAAERHHVVHQCLTPGALCPSCKRGKVYEQRTRPHLLVRVEGQPPLKATVYELQALRCNLCGETFVAEPPPGVGYEKYDVTSRVMIGLLKYGSGLPFNRLERLEGNLGVPLPASTQWEIARDAGRDLAPAYEALIYAAAQGDLLHNDDTSMRVLSLMKENEELRASGQTKARTGIFVTGVVSIAEGREIALFFTGRKHAGENLQDVLAQRREELGPPLQMSDALDRNDPAIAETIRGCCLAHARRKYVEASDSFPTECKHVLKQIALVYKHDKEARDFTPEARLAHHLEHSKPVLDALKKWLAAQLDERHVEPNSSLGGAISYTQNHWHELTLFLREPGAPLDNNVCERGLKRPILHRKNSLFYKTLNGARVGDVFMSLIHTAEVNDVNAFDYLVALLRHAREVERDPAAWLPWNYSHAIEVLDG